MKNFKSTIINRFDQVKLLTTKNVKYLSAPPNSTIQPDGIWSVIGGIKNDLLLSKDNAIIRIPPSDVLKIFNYDLSEVLSKLGKLSNGKARKS